MIFNSQKNDNQGKSSADGQLSFNQSDVELGNFEIHTMKKDLKNINNPQYFNNSEENNEPIESKPIQSEFSSARPDSRQRTSPFLSQNIKRENESAPVNIVLPSNIKNEPAKENISISAGPTPHTASSWGKLVLFACIIFLLVAAGAGGYYFWMNKKSVQKSPENTNALPANTKPTLATDKPNYLNVDTTGGSINITTAIDKYIKQVQEENSSTPIEFIIVNSQNNPILFKEFAQKTNITLPANITEKLKDTFSFFIYLDEEIPRVGIAVDSNDLIGTNLKEALTKSEPDMINEMKPLYLSASVVSDNSSFATSYYGGAEIRYKNIESASGSSLDYTIFRDKLIFGTSKMTLRSIINYLSANDKVKGVEDVIEDIPEEELQNGKI